MYHSHVDMWSIRSRAPLELLGVAPGVGGFKVCEMRKMIWYPALPVVISTMSTYIRGVIAVDIHHRVLQLGLFKACLEETLRFLIGLWRVRLDVLL
mmetsp:Transcript_16140/g.19383  ORF Transcript_16140/g.19383 Transcript_16140/m.19383 type:complete len:96 (+) Transcript_16140:68-355(+)